MFKAFLQTSSLEASMMVHALNPAFRRQSRWNPVSYSQGHTVSQANKQTNKIKKQESPNQPILGFQQGSSGEVEHLLSLPGSALQPSQPA